MRINLIYNGFEVLKQHYLIGVGPGNMNYYMENYEVYPTKGISNMHNYWMEILLDYGVIIFAIFVFYYLKLTIEMIKAYCCCKSKKITAIYIGFLFFICSFIVASISSSNNLTKEWLWLLVGIILAFVNITTKKYENIKNEEEKCSNDKVQS